MLFQFDADGQWGIWMKDMKFPIDILWADASGAIVYIVSDATPASYPTVFTPPLPARYVLELPAGYLAAHKLKVGDTLAL